MKVEMQGYTFPPYFLKPNLELARSYLLSLSDEIDLSYVPLTYMIFLRGEVHGVDLFKDLDIPRKKALHGGQRYEWFEPIKWDDELKVEVTVTKIVEKESKSGKLWFTDLQYDYFNVSSNQIVIREITRIIKKD
jgi:N-terminal half of MaoC dehydratase